MKTYVIVGSGTAGITAAVELRKLDRQSKILILTQSTEMPYSPCSLPFVISGEIPNFNDIMLFDGVYFESQKIEYLAGASVISLNPAEKSLIYVHNNQENILNYDRLVLATGASARVPPIPGLEDADYLILKTVEDAKTIMDKASAGKKAVIVGAGMVGIELADALRKKGLNVTVIESQPDILCSMLDKKMSSIVKLYLEQLGITVHTGASITRVTSDKVIAEEKSFDYDLLFVCTGISPSDGLARNSGLAVDNGILVNEHMQSSNPDIYACGDAVRQESCAWIATNAMLQAKVAAEHIAGRPSSMREVFNTMVTKAGGLVIAATGFPAHYLEEKGTETNSATFTGQTRAEYHPDSKKLVVHLVADKGGIIKGAQIIGEEDVTGRINWLALAVQKQVTAEELSSAESCYNPAAASLYDPVIVAAQILARKNESR